MAYIERVQVENEGFLAGLDVRLTPGLNVIIGARGTGKTSLIELIRYGLDAGALTTKAGTKGEQQAVAVLDGGAVTLTVREGSTKWTVTRSAEGVMTTTLTEPPSCTVLAQNEVESIGVSPQGRLFLVDRFLPDSRELGQQIRLAADGVRVLTEEISSVLAEVDKVDEALTEMKQVQVDLGEARALQEALLAKSTATESDQQALRDAQARLQALAQRESQLRYAETALVEIQTSSDEIHNRILELPSSEIGIMQGRTSSRAARIAQLLQQTLGELALALEELTDEIAAVAHTRASLDEESRALRQRLDSAQDGLSQASRRVQVLEERKGQMDALKLRRTDLRRRLQALRQRRTEALENLEGLRSRRLQARQAIASELSTSLGPHIRVRVTPGEGMDEYVSALISGLRGSGLHYNNLAPSLAVAMSPSELIDWVERSAIDDIAGATGLSTERSAAIVSALRKAGTSSIIASDVDDDVSLELLDGPDYKPVEHLSIGQRCTVVLPILLALRGEPLVVDQPEDHLDNAFITSTLISTIRQRDGFGQTIFSSHNANIPVLGDAENVLVMSSDGESGLLSDCGPLTSPTIIEAISEIMEGGKEAFEARAIFYRQNGQET